MTVMGIAVSAIAFVTGAMVGFSLAYRRFLKEMQERTRLEEQVRHLAPVQNALSQSQQENTELKLALAELRKEKEAQQEKVAWIEKAEAQLREAFQALSVQTFQAHANAHIQRVRELMESLQHVMRGDWGKYREEISGLLRPVQERLQELDRQVREMEKHREGAYQGLQQHLHQLQNAYGELRDTTTALTAALTRSVTVRGTWGEIELRRLVELAGLTPHVDFDPQESGDQGRPDMIIRLPNRRCIPVDAKTPLQSYRQVLEAKTDAERQQRLKSHAQAIRSLVNDLRKREYWRLFDPPAEFTVMFLPHEGVLSAAFEGDRDLLEYAIQQRVLPATPVTLLALLKAIAQVWQQQEIAENAQRIAQAGRELCERVGHVLDPLARVGNALGTAVAAYNDAIGSLEGRLLPCVRKVQQACSPTETLPDMSPVEKAVREVKAKRNTPSPQSETL